MSTIIIIFICALVVYVLTSHEKNNRDRYGDNDDYFEW